MALPLMDIPVDGVTYRLRRVGAFDGLRLDVLALKMVGPIVKALALSDNAKGILAAFTGGDEAKVSELLDKDVGAALALLGLSLDEIADKLQGDAVIAATRLMFLKGRLNAPYGEHRVDVDDESTFDEIVTHYSHKHGHTHALKLLWAGLRANLGPTIAGST